MFGSREEQRAVRPEIYVDSGLVLQLMHELGIHLRARLRERLQRRRSLVPAVGQHPAGSMRSFPSRFAAFHHAVTTAAHEAIAEVCGGQGVVTCRFTHVYPDGVAPYYGIYASGRWGSTVAQWDEIKAAVSNAIIANGGTITHHHAVGRDHRPWYDQQRPEPFTRALRAAKSALDPAGILNPGVIV